MIRVDPGPRFKLVKTYPEVNSGLCAVHELMLRVYTLIENNRYYHPSHTMLVIHSHYTWLFHAFCTAAHGSELAVGTC